MVGTITCPSCLHLVKTADIEEPSPEQRGEINNLNQGVPPTDYYFYRKHDKKQTEEDYFDKGTKPFPGNKTIPVDFESPESAKTSDLRDRFTYAICDNCNRRIIQIADGEKEYSIEVFEELRDPESGLPVYEGPKNPYLLIEISDGENIYKMIYPASQLGEVTPEQAGEFVMKVLPKQFEELIIKHCQDAKIQGYYWEDWCNEFVDLTWAPTDNLRYSLSDFYEYKELDALAEKYAEQYGVKDAILEQDFQALHEHIDSELEDKGFEWAMNHFEYVKDDQFDDLAREYIKGGWSYDKANKYGEDIIEWDFGQSRYSGRGSGFNFNEISKEVRLHGDENMTDDYTKEIEEEYFDYYKKKAMDWCSGDYANELMTFLFRGIERRLQDIGNDEDWYYESNGEMKPCYPSVDYKKFFLFAMNEGLDGDISSEEATAIPVKGEISASLKSIEIGIYREAGQPDILQDDSMYDKNNPVDPNQPANQNPVMGNDFSRFESSADVEKVLKRHRKNNQGIVHSV